MTAAQQIDAAWMVDAACAGEDQYPFFPDRGSSKTTIQYAKTFCSQCPVVDECLNYALTWRIDHGVWGNTKAEERRIMRKPEAPPGFQRHGQQPLAVFIEGAVHGTLRRYRLGCKCVECLWVEQTRTAIWREQTEAKKIAG